MPKKIFEFCQWRFQRAISGGGARPHAMASAVARACNGAPSGVRGRAPKAGALLAFGRLIEASNLLTFVKFGNEKNQIFVLSLQKILGGYETGGGAGAKLGGLCPRPWTETVTGFYAISQTFPIIRKRANCTERVTSV